MGVPKLGACRLGVGGTPLGRYKDGKKQGRIYEHENNVPTALPSTAIRLLKDLLLAI